MCYLLETIKPFQVNPPGFVSNNLFFFFLLMSSRNLTFVCFWRNKSLVELSRKFRLHFRHCYHIKPCWRLFHTCNSLNKWLQNERMKGIAMSMLLIHRNLSLSRLFRNLLSRDFTNAKCISFSSHSRREGCHPAYTCPESWGTSLTQFTAKTPCPMCVYIQLFLHSIYKTLTFSSSRFSSFSI